MADSQKLVAYYQEENKVKTDVKILECYTQSERSSPISYCDNCWRNGIVEDSMSACFTCELNMCAPCFDRHMFTHPTDLTIAENMGENSLHKFINDLLHFEMQNINEAAGSLLDDIINRTPIFSKHSREYEECHITDMCHLSDDKIALVDQKNKTLKIIDVESRKLTRCFQFSAHPFGATVVEHMSPNHIAITFPDEEQIMIINIVADTNQNTKVVHVNGPCSGITAHPTAGIIAISGSSLYVIDESEILVEIKMPTLEASTRERYFLVIGPHATVYMAISTTSVIYSFSSETKTKDSLRLKQEFKPETPIYCYGLCLDRAGNFLLSTQNGILRITRRAQAVSNPYMVTFPGAIIETNRRFLVCHSEISVQRNSITVMSPIGND